jgi:hypothetical protein
VEDLLNRADVSNLEVTNFTFLDGNMGNSLGGERAYQPSWREFSDSFPLTDPQPHYHDNSNSAFSGSGFGLNLDTNSRSSIPDIGMDGFSNLSNFSTSSKSK